MDDCGCLDDAGTTFTGLITHYQTTALSNPVPAFSFWLPFSRFGTHMDNIYWRFTASLPEGQISIDYPLLIVGTDTCRWYLKFASQKNLKVSQLRFLLPITSGASSICSHSDNFYLSIPVQLKTVAIAKTLKHTWRVSIQ